MPNQRTYIEQLNVHLCKFQYISENESFAVIGYVSIFLDSAHFIKK